MKVIYKTIEAFSDHERFLKFIRVNSVSGCWEWGGNKGRLGYGLFNVNKMQRFAHRVSFSIFSGDIKDDYVIDHKCKNTSCVNPEHIRQVTQSVNSLENSDSPCAKNKVKEFCANGHRFTEENTINSKTGRRCAACIKINNDKKNKLINKGRGLPGLRTHCPSGHEYTKENTYVYKKKNQRLCRECRKKLINKYNKLRPKKGEMGCA